MIRSYPKFEIDENLLKKRKWREFYLKELGFKNYHGKRLIQSKRKRGDIPLITAGENNNGVADFICNEEMKKFKDVISVDMFGNSFYHPYVCTGDDNIYFFENNKLSKLQKLFIIQMINKNKIKFSYGNQFRQPDADKLKIILPVKNNKPDYEFMQNFIKEIEKLKLKRYLIFIEEELKNLEYKEIPKLDEVEWREFWISEVFDEIKRGKRHIERNRKKGDIPYYSASKENNGLTDFISNPKFLIKENAIIYSTFGDAYYANKNFTASDEIAILIHKKLNLFNGLFISTTLNKNKIKYSFGRKAFINKINRDKIFLPTKNNQPDFEYMEQFIKNIIFEKYKNYLNFIS